MSETRLQRLSRRERQIMDVIYRLGSATAADIEAALPDAPSNSAVRTLLRLLEEKGHLRHSAQGRRYIYTPTQPRQAAGRGAIRQVVQTFFGGSVERAVATLLADSEANISPEELDRLAEMIARAKTEGR